MPTTPILYRVYEAAGTSNPADPLQQPFVIVHEGLEADAAQKAVAQAEYCFYRWAVPESFKGHGKEHLLPKKVGRPKKVTEPARDKAAGKDHEYKD